MVSLPFLLMIPYITILYVVKYSQAMANRNCHCLVFYRLLSKTTVAIISTAKCKGIKPMETANENHQLLRQNILVAVMNQFVGIDYT